MKVGRNKRLAEVVDRRGGTVAVEGAIVLSSLLIILFGMLDLALLVLESNTLAEAARRLCRQAAVHGQMASPLMTTWGPTSVSGTAADGTECGQALSPELVTFDLTQVNYVIAWPDGANQPGNRVSVTVTYAYQPMMPFVFGNTAIQLQDVTTMEIDH
jgi:Flp pilus assembly protein TadG